MQFALKLKTDISQLLLKFHWPCDAYPMFTIPSFSMFAACQVQVQAGGSTPKIRPVKPKFYLMGCVVIKPSQWVKL